MVHQRILGLALLQRKRTGGQLDVVVFGHTHKTFDLPIGGVSFFNPGYADWPKLNSRPAWQS